MVEKVKTATQKELIEAIEVMEGMLSCTCAKVVGLCNIGLNALETPAGQRDTEPIAQMLRTIMHLVSEMDDCISYEIEQAGVSVPLDDAQSRRAAARLVAFNTGTSTLPPTK